jgi:hypothetical protein
MLNAPPPTSLHFEKLTERHACRLIQLMEVTDSHRQTILNFEMAIIKKKIEQDQGMKQAAVAAQQQPAKRNISIRRQGKLDKTSGQRRKLLLHCTSTIDTKSTPLFLPRKIKKTRRNNQQQVPPPSVTPPSSCLSPQLAPLAPRTIEDDKNHDLPREATTSPAYYTNTNSTSRSPHVVSVPTESKNNAPAPPPSPKDQEGGGSIPQYVSFDSNNVASSSALLCRQRSSSSSRRLSVTLSLSSLDEIDIECDIPSPVTTSWNDDRDKVTEFLCGNTCTMLDDSGGEKNAHGKEHQHTATPHGSPLRRRIPDTITCTKQEEQAHDEQQDVETTTDTSTRKRRRRNSTPSFVSSHEAAPEEAQRRESAKAFQNFLFPESNCTPSCSHDAALLVHLRRRSTKTFQNFFFPESGSC